MPLVRLGLDVGFFVSALESSMDCVRVVDLEGRLVFMNRAGRAALEVEDFAPLAGREWASVWPEPGRSEIRRGIAAVNRGETYRFQGECPTASGTPKWWDVTIAPVRDNDGELACIIATSRDTTVERRSRIDTEANLLTLARSEAALQSAFRIAHVGGWEINFITRRTLFSPQLRELFGSPSLPDMSMADANTFWIEDDQARFQAAVDHVERLGEPMTFEGRSPGIDGAVRWWRVFGEPVLEGARCVALRGAAQEVTQWREAREREQSAVRAADQMSGFLATMSHEIRTPLNGVLGMAQAMGRGELSPVQRDRLEVIEASGEALLSLLNDVLDLSKIEAGKVELEEGVVDVEALASGARAIFTALVKDKDLSLQLSIAPSAQGHWAGDPDRIRQVLHNLVSNAVKFTEHGAVGVSFLYAAGHLILRVEDTGVGIPADRLEHVFDRFVQVDASTTRRYGGSGLGLTICRELATLMGGEISVESVEGQGAAFTVSLPLAHAEGPVPTEPEAEQPSGATVDGHGLRVLAAEDNAINQLVLKTLLAEVGIEPVMVANGREALDALGAAPWDIVLMDIQMPVMDGLTAVKQWREAERREGRPRTPVIALTANAMSHHTAEYLAAGMDAMVPKPINLATLLQTIDQALGPEAAAHAA